MTVNIVSDPLPERFSRWHHQHWRWLWTTVAMALVAAASVFFAYSERLKKQAHWGPALVHEAFSEPTLSNRWRVATGSFAVRHGELVATGDDESTIFFMKRLGGDVAIEYDGRFLPETPEGDLSVMWSEREPLIGVSNARFSLQVGAGGNFHSTISETGKGQLVTSEFRITPGRTHRFRIEIAPERLSIQVDGKEICATDLDIPTGVGYIGLYGYSAGKAFDNVRIFTRELPEQISCLAIGDRDFREGDFAKAAEEYQQVAITHAGKPIEDEALYRQGLALHRSGDFANARSTWTRISEPKWRRLSDIQKLSAAIDERKFAETIAGIHQLYAEDPLLVDRLLRLWAVAARAAVAEPLAIRAGLLGCFDAYFSANPMAISAASELLRSMGGHDEVLQRFARHPDACIPTLLALGRADEVAKRFPTARGSIVRAMIDQGLFTEVLALQPPIAWAERQVRILRGEFQHVTTVPASGRIPGGAYLSGLAAQVADLRPDSPEYLRALVFSDQFDRALTVPVTTASQRFWRRSALALGGREEEFRNDLLQASIEGEDTPIPYWLAIRAFARGDRDAARAELDQIRVQAGWYEKTEIAFAHGIIAPFLEFIDGDCDACAARFDEIIASRKGVLQQRLWYAASYITGRIDDEQFRQQPVVVQQVGLLAICRALRAEWNSQLTEAAAAYQAYLALPPHQRLTIGFDRDAATETFAAWRAAALAR